MADEPKTISEILFEGFCRFLFSAFYGAIVSLVLFFIFLRLSVYFSFSARWYHIFWIIPVLWGILGVFRFDEMLEDGRSIIEGVFSSGFSITSFINPWSDPDVDTQGYARIYAVIALVAGLLGGLFFLPVFAIDPIIFIRWVLLGICGYFTVLTLRYW